MVGWGEIVEELLNIRGWLTGEKEGEEVPTNTSISGITKQVQTLQQQE